jgi:hypothetical protein
MPLRSISRAHEKPQYQPKEREQQNDNDPQEFPAIVSRALENIDKCPDVADQNQHAKDATAVSEVHHLEFPCFYSALLPSPAARAAVTRVRPQRARFYAHALRSTVA